jgi:hypothetical protein
LWQEIQTTVMDELPGKPALPCRGRLHLAEVDAWAAQWKRFHIDLRRFLAKAHLWAVHSDAVLVCYNPPNIDTIASTLDYIGK